MKFRHAFLASIATAAFCVGSANAQTGASEATSAVTVEIKQGDNVVDPQGGAVGTIAGVQAGNAIVDTGTHKATLPIASFAKSDKGLMISATKAQLDQMVSAAANELKSQIVVGANVADTTGGSVGKIIEVGADFAVVETAAKNQVRLPLASFAKGPSGPVIGATAAQLDQAAASAASGQKAAQGGS